jgi:DNA-binding transcriptional MerR regulator
VRYYVQRGLLPAPAFKGRDTVYEAEHLVRLKAIKRLQDRFLPLDAIQVELARLSADELKALAEGTDAPSGPVPAPHPPRLPGPPPPPLPSPPSARWERWELLPGLELHLSDHADAATRALAERLRTQVEKDTNGGAP